MKPRPGASNVGVVGVVIVLMISGVLAAYYFQSAQPGAPGKKTTTTEAETSSGAQAGCANTQVSGFGRNSSSETTASSSLAPGSRPGLSLVSANGTVSATIDDMKHKVFSAAGRYWVFYQDVCLNFGFQSSADGARWSRFSPVFAEPNGVGDSANAIYDSSHDRVWVVTGDVYNSTKITYRYGTPEPDGTIVWSGPARQIDGRYINPLPDAVIDSRGVMWNTEVTNTSSHELYVFRNGTMVAPIEANPSDTAVIGTLVPAGPGEMYALVGGGDWQTAPLQIFYTTDDGRSWSSPVNVTGTFLVDGSSAVVINGTLYVAAGSLPGPMFFTYRMGDPGVGNVRMLDNLSSDLRGPVADAAIASDGGKELFVVYTDGQNIYSRTSSDGGADWSGRVILMQGVQLMDTPFSVSPVILNGVAIMEWESLGDTIWFQAVKV